MGNEACAGEDAPLLLHAYSSVPAPLPVAPPSAAAAADDASTTPAALAVQSGAKPMHPAGVPWGTTASLLLADMFGIGALALPSVFSRLGWLVSCLQLALLATGCAYLGVLFSRLAVALPNAATMDEIGSAALGATGRRLVFAVSYVAVVAHPLALHITCMLALQQVLPGLSTLLASAAIACLMLPLAQIQNIHDMGWLSLLASACMAGAVFATLIRLLAMPGNALAATSLLPPPDTRPIEGLIAALNLCFAFGGQVNWMRYVSSMAHRDEFRYSAEVADGAMTVMYVLIGCVGYAKLGGSGFDPSLPLTSVLPAGALTRLINLALLVRCLVAYTLNVNVFTDLALTLGKPWLERVRAAHPRLGRRACWGAVSVTCVVLSLLVAWAVPKFDLCVALIAAFGEVAAPYTLTSLFALALLPGMHHAERTFLKLLAPASFLFALFGLYASGYRLAEVLLGRG